MITTIYDISKRTGMSFSQIENAIKSGDLHGEIIPIKNHNMIVTDDHAVNEFLESLG